MQGRPYVLPTDVARVASDVMAHRLLLSFDAVADGVDPRIVVQRVVSAIPAPQPVWGGAGQPEFH
jgi:MoxR-like ATPase